MTTAAEGWMASHLRARGTRVNSLDHYVEDKPILSRQMYDDIMTYGPRECRKRGLISRNELKLLYQLACKIGPAVETYNLLPEP